MYRTHDGCVYRLLGCSSCYTEIGNLNSAVIGYDHILRLDVTVYYAVFVSLFDASNYLKCQSDGFLGAHGSLSLDIGF